MAHPLLENLEQHDRLSDEERGVLLAAIRREQEHRAGEDIIRQGDRPWESTIVLEGFAARYKVQADGKRQISSLHVPGDFVDLHSFLLTTMDHSVLALTRCKVATVPHDALRDITENHPHLTRLLWLSTVIDGAIHREWLTQMGAGEANRRTAHLVCEIAVRLGRTGERSFEFPLTQADLADMLGISHVHMNRVLTELRENGLATWRGGVFSFDDWDRLRAFAHFDPAYLNRHLDQH